MLRALVALLVLANALFFAWTAGWLAPAWPSPKHGEREPERRAAQVRPELIKVLSPRMASAALSAAKAASMAVGEGEACLEAGPFTDATISAAEAALAAAGLPGGSWSRAAGLGPSASRHWLRIDRADSAIQQQLRGLKAAALGAGFVPCR